MPPRQGQSQFISPVSGLNAPSEEASSSRPAGEEDERPPENSLDDWDVGIWSVGVVPVVGSRVCRCFVRSRRGMESRSSGDATSAESSVSLAGPGKDVSIRKCVHKQHSVQKQLGGH
jgi:hypothetical protein